MLSIDWQQPLWLLLSLQPLVLWLALQWLQKHSQELFADKHLLPWIQVHEEKNLKQHLLSRNLLYSLAWILLALSLAGPRLPDLQQKNKNDITLDIMMVVDVSRSMHATDIIPTRIRRAVLESYELLSFAKNARIGIVVYAARPHLFVPLTTDFNALKFYLNDLDSLQLPTRGSQSSLALSFAIKELTIQTQAQNKSQKQKQVLLWFTDGDFDHDNTTENAKLEETISQASKDNINTYILGLGTSEGSAIPLSTHTGSGGWLESKGQGVISQMDSQKLQQLSEKGQGVFSPVRDNDSDWKALYHQGMLQGLPLSKDDRRHWKQLYPWFLFPAIGLLVIALFPFSFSSAAPLKRRTNKSKKLSNTSLTVITIGTTIIGTTIIGTTIIGTTALIYSKPIFASDEAHQSSYQTTVLAGINAYKKSEFSKAKGDFIKAVLNAKTEKERALALHNLGNSLFQIGDYANASIIFTDALLYAPEAPEQKQTLQNQQLAIALYSLLEKRRAKAQSALNNSPNTPANPNSKLLDLPDNLPFMLNTKTKSLLEFTLPQLPQDEWTRLLEKGMEHLQLIESDKQPQSQKRQKHKLNVELARIYLSNLEEKSITSSDASLNTKANPLWKRLFEVEEGFPAKLKKQQEVPGIRPW